MTSAPQPATRPNPTVLTKAQFVTKMEAVCTRALSQIHRLPKPSSPQDLVGMATDLQGLLTLYPPYMAQADALVGRAADKAALTRNWLALEKSDFAVSAPAFRRFIASVRAGDQAGIATDGHALAALPDHGPVIARFMTGYGLKTCATLQDASTEG